MVHARTILKQGRNQEFLPWPVHCGKNSPIQNLQEYFLSEGAWPHSGYGPALRQVEPESRRGTVWTRLSN